MPPAKVPPSKKKAAPKTYRAHRDRQRHRILEAARLLFCQRGIDRVSMAEITAATGLQPSTIYQYFSNKDDIVWAILTELFASGAERIQHRIDSAPNGLARITALLEFMAEELSTHAENVRFMAQFDAIYAHDWPAERLLTLESQINPQGFRVFRKWIREGIADGSLRPDLDPGLTMHAVLNAAIGAQRRLASLGDKIEVEYGQPVDKLFRETIRILLLGLRAPQPTNRRKAAHPPATRPRTSKRRTA